MCYQKAAHHYSDAYRRFDKLHHYLGKYLCKVHEMNITTDSDRKSILVKEVSKRKR